MKRRPKTAGKTTRKAVRKPGPDTVAGLRAEIVRLELELAEEQAGRHLGQEALLDAQMALEANAGRYADLYDFAPVGYLTMSRSGVIRDINFAGARLLNGERERLLGRPLLALVARVDRRKFQNYLITLQKKPSEITTELNFDGRAGSRVLQLTSIVSSDRLLTEVQFRTIVTDITERKQIESSLVQLNETMTAMLEAIPDVVFVANPGGQIRFQNEAATHFLAATGLAGLPASIQPELEKAVLTRRHSLPTGLKNLHRFVIGHDERFYLSRVMCLLGSENQPFGAVAMLQDVTDLRLLDEVKTGLISTVSHELKTPITSVRTALLVLLEQTFGPLTAKQIELLSLARDEGERLLNTLNTLLDLTRFESNAVEMRTEEVKPRELVTEAVASVSSMAVHAQMKITTDVASGLPVLAVDRERILHVLTNLLTNAIKYSPTESEIVVSARVDERGVYFGVKDDGPGVPEQYRARIFEKFFRVPGLPAQGAGLGLSIAREFVRVHGGQIGLRSEEGKGSEFYFVLPVERN